MAVLVAEDDAEMASALSRLFQATPSLVLVGWATDGGRALELNRELRPDVVLMDVRMPGMDGIAATAELVREGRDGRPRVLVLTTFAVDDYLVQALAAGASGFLPKTAPWDEVVEAIHAVDRGEAVVPPGLLRRLVDRVLPVGPSPELADTLEVLTAREQEVLALVGQGLTNGEIAEALSVSLATVRTHVEHMRSKLGARDRIQLALVGSRMR
ncbi:MAG: response regulator [Acidimicrobiales bacterium]